VRKVRKARKARKARKERGREGREGNEESEEGKLSKKIPSIWRTTIFFNCGKCLPTPLLINRIASNPV
jgi:hypothetical protein